MVHLRTLQEMGDFDRNTRVQWVSKENHLSSYTLTPNGHLENYAGDHSNSSYYSLVFSYEEKPLFFA